MYNNKSLILLVFKIFLNPLIATFYFMSNNNSDPLHGVTLQKIMEHLVDYYGFDTLGKLITIKCFTTNPSIKSSLIFLRKTDWARKKVEDLYINSLR